MHTFGRRNSEKKFERERAGGGRRRVGRGGGVPNAHPRTVVAQEDAQQPVKAKFPAGEEPDAVLVSVHAAPPFWGKRDPLNAYIPLRTVTSSPSHQKLAGGEEFKSRAPQTL